MNSLNFTEDLKEKINSCSRCGLCLSVCPVFELTKNDCTSPRGKCVLLNEIFKNNNRFSNLQKKYMGMCTNCGKCLDYCPSKIDIIKINKIFNPPPLYLNIFRKIFSIILSFIYKNHFTKIKLNKNIKIAYVKPYLEKNIPEFIKQCDYTVFDSLNCDFNFSIQYPEFSKIIAKNLAEKISKKDFDYIFTNNIFCKHELEKGFKLINSNKKTVYLEDF